MVISKKVINVYYQYVIMQHVPVVLGVVVQIQDAVPEVHSMVIQEIQIPNGIGNAEQVP